MIKRLIPILILSLFITSCAQKNNDTALPWTENPVIPPDTADSLPVANATEPSTECTEPEIVYDDNGHKPAVLMYHLIMEEPYNNLEALFVKPSDFESHVEILQNEGYIFLFADDYNLTEKPSVMLTFDDGYEDNYSTMFPILKKYGAKATIFVISDLIGTDGYLTAEQVKEMSDSGLVYIGCHTASHCDLSTQTNERIRNEFEKSVKIIESITGKPCKALAYPAGGQNNTVTSIASEYFNYAYISRPSVPDGVQTDMKIPRYYISRGMGPKNVLNTINP